MVNSYNWEGVGSRKDLPVGTIVIHDTVRDKDGNPLVGVTQGPGTDAKYSEWTYPVLWDRKSDWGICFDPFDKLYYLKNSHSLLSTCGQCFAKFFLNEPDYLCQECRSI